MTTRRAPLHRSNLKRKPRRYVVPAEVLAYWDWIRQQPCAVTGHPSIEYPKRIEVAHVGTRGLSQKGDPWEVIPLCRFHHARWFPVSHHTLGKKFWTFHGLDRYELIRRFREQYFGLTGLAASRETGSVRPGGGLS